MSQSDGGQNNVAGAGANDAAAADVPSNDSQENPPTPPYLRLISPCWEHIFGFLSLEDILQTGETCTQIHRMVGNYVCKYFRNLRYDLIAGEVYTKMQQNLRLPALAFQLRTDFCQFIPKLYIGKKSELDYFLDPNTLFSLKTLTFESIELTEIQVQYTRNVLKNIENLHLKYCDIDGKAFEQLIAYCPKLKFLNVYDCDMMNTSQKFIFSQYCPTLEHFQYETGLENQRQFNELKAFLEIHTNLKCFESECNFLWTHRDQLIDTNIHLERLTIHFYQWNDLVTIDQFVNFLKALHAHGFYKTLHIAFKNTYSGREEFLKSISTLPLEILTDISPYEIDLMHLTQLKELNVSMWFDSGNMDTLTKSLIKLERLTINSATVDIILSFLRHASKLKIIKIKRDLFNMVLDVSALNEERKKLLYASKVSICLPEDLYLWENWKSNNLDLSHVRITRFDL